jgi:hypothetical protein
MVLSHSSKKEEEHFSPLFLFFFSSSFSTSDVFSLFKHRHTDINDERDKKEARRK